MTGAAVIQPGGSPCDAEVIAMALTGMRHFLRWARWASARLSIVRRRQGDAAVDRA